MIPTYGINGDADTCGCKVADFSVGGMSNLLLNPHMDMHAVERGKAIVLGACPVPRNNDKTSVYGIADHASTIPQIDAICKHYVEKYCNSLSSEYANVISPLITTNLSLPNFGDSKIENAYRVFYIGSSKNIQLTRGPMHTKEALLFTACPDVSLKAASIQNTKNPRCQCLRFIPVNFGGQLYFSEKDATGLESIVSLLLGQHRLTNRFMDTNLPSYITELNRFDILSFVAYSILHSFSSNQFTSGHFWQFSPENLSSTYYLRSAKNQMSKCNVSMDDMSEIMELETPQELVEFIGRMNTTSSSSTGKSRLCLQRIKVALEHSSYLVKSNFLDVLATISQNNEDVQNYVYKNSNFVQDLSDTVKKENLATIYRCKLVYALSSLVRGNPEGRRIFFDDCDGIETLRIAFRNAYDEADTRAAGRIAIVAFHFFQDNSNNSDDTERQKALKELVLNVRGKMNEQHSAYEGPMDYIKDL